jgi:hypothetical protein
MIGYHCATPKKLARYQATGAILPPVRFWRTEATARAWMQRTGRPMLLEIEVPHAYPMPDHRPRMMAWWTDAVVRQYRVMEVADD